MKSLPIRRRDFATAQFAGWLARMGAEVGVPTNPYEVVRYRAYFDGSRQATTHIVYAKEDGRLTFTGGSAEHYRDFLAGGERQPALLAVPKAKSGSTEGESAVGGEAAETPNLSSHPTNKGTRQ